MCDEFSYCVHNLDNKIIMVSNIISTTCAPSVGKVLSSDVTHYVVPDVGVVRDFLEILEFRELQGIVLTQTAYQTVQHTRGRRSTSQIIFDISFTLFYCYTWCIFKLLLLMLCVNKKGKFIQEI